MAKRQNEPEHVGVARAIFSFLSASNGVQLGVFEAWGKQRQVTPDVLQKAFGFLNKQDLVVYFGPEDRRTVRRRPGAVFPEGVSASDAAVGDEEDEGTSADGEESPPPAPPVPPRPDAVREARIAIARKSAEGPALVAAPAPAPAPAPARPGPLPPKGSARELLSALARMPAEQRDGLLRLAAEHEGLVARRDETVARLDAEIAASQALIDDVIAGRAEPPVKPSPAPARRRAMRADGSNLEERILAAMEPGAEVRFGDLVEKLGLDRGTVSSACTKLVAEQRLVRCRYGVYALPGGST